MNDHTAHTHFTTNVIASPEVMEKARQIGGIPDYSELKFVGPGCIDSDWGLIRLILSFFKD